LTKKWFGPANSDRNVLVGLNLLDYRILSAIAFLKLRHEADQSAMHPLLVKIQNWIKKQQEKPSGVYSCYTSPDPFLGGTMAT
jgi:hypothetical protein